MTMQDTSDSDGSPEETPVAGKRKRVAPKAAAVQAKTPKTSQGQRPSEASVAEQTRKRFALSKEEYDKREQEKSCYKCGKGGHWARNCPNGESNSGQKRQKKGLEKRFVKKPKEDH